MRNMCDHEYPYKVEGTFLVKGTRVAGIYETLPCGGYNIIDKATKAIIASGTLGAESEVAQIEEIENGEPNV